MQKSGARFGNKVAELTSTHSSQMTNKDLLASNVMDASTVNRLIEMANQHAIKFKNIYGSKEADQATNALCKCTCKYIKKL